MAKSNQCCGITKNLTRCQKPTGGKMFCHLHRKGLRRMCVCTILLGSMSILSNYASLRSLFESDAQPASESIGEISLLRQQIADIELAKTALQKALETQKYQSGLFAGELNGIVNVLKLDANESEEIRRLSQVLSELLENFDFEFRGQPLEQSESDVLRIAKATLLNSKG